MTEWNIRLTILAALIVALVWLDVWAASQHITNLPIAANAIVGMVGAVSGVSALIKSVNGNKP